jgi:hypothetical protein
MRQYIVVPECYHGENGLCVDGQLIPSTIYALNAINEFQPVLMGDRGSG